MFPWDWGFSGVSVANSGLSACGEMSGHESHGPPSYHAQSTAEICSDGFSSCATGLHGRLHGDKDGTVVAILENHIRGPGSAVVNIIASPSPDKYLKLQQVAYPPVVCCSRVARSQQAKRRMQLRLI